MIAAVKAMEPIFERAESKIPAIHVTVGWPSDRGTSEKKRTIGQCCTGEASKDGLHQIFISPWLDEVEVFSGYGVLPTLAHEVVHAVVGIAAKHGPVFKKLARAIGLEGKLTATIAGEKLAGELKVIAEALGPFPTARWK